MIPKNSLPQDRDFVDPVSWDLNSGAIYVDIGSLENEEHRSAFRFIFTRMLEENRDILDGLPIIGISAKLPIEDHGGSLLSLPLKWSDLRKNSSLVADALYDSSNDHVSFRLRGGEGAAELQVSFDNPEFSLRWLAPSSHFGKP